MEQQQLDLDEICQLTQRETLSMREMKDKPSHLSLVGPSGELKLYTQSNNPDDFEDLEIEIPSVIAELNYNFKQYHIDRKDPKTFDWFTFTNLPDDVRMIVNTMRTNVDFSKEVGSQVTMSCCLTLGLAKLNVSGSIRRLTETRYEFNRRKKVGSPIEKFICQYLDMDVPIQSETGRRVKVAVSLDVKSQIVSISDSTGLTQSNVGVLAMYASMAKQIESTPDNLKEIWQNRLDQSLELIECKVKGAKAIIGMLK